MSVLCRNMENVRSIGRASRSVGCFPTESVCMLSSATDQVQCKASCFEAFCGFPRLAPSVCVFSLRSTSVEVAPSHRSLDIFVLEHCILTAITYTLLLMKYILLENVKLGMCSELILGFFKGVL